MNQNELSALVAWFGIGSAVVAAVAFVYGATFGDLSPEQKNNIMKGYPPNLGLGSPLPTLRDGPRPDTPPGLEYLLRAGRADRQS